ncbi:hypothetical protein M422DRAFT_782811 [Sphaerobolus stellatus SS14]|uniref:SEP domain-containing protein n=1 Tax=Sphaerobolus stellatus (strain SS14) TaxID=990650 RepID=A0A0C9TWB0_SPHS4|nr:hypothetical protein M422DRAFT_786043 [Sphaerobolus stellatus SS14]KIJ34668.1 hypothetical protein M422DRAFT_782811 [Sphaerobolus stellatus SS14]
MSSNISVENPDRRSGNNTDRDILPKAAEASAPAQPAAEEGDDQEVATRHITFWRDGFSVGDGALMRYDKPENSRILDGIANGYAPPEILDVRVGQLVELRVTRRLNEDYIPPPKCPLAHSAEKNTVESGKNTIVDILRKAAKAPAQPAAEEGDDQEVAKRRITFWRDGFSIGDGALMRYDKPENSRILDEINIGHAPPQILDVRVGQPVELKVFRRLNENYIPPLKRPLAHSAEKDAVEVTTVSYTSVLAKIFTTYLC